MESQRVGHDCVIENTQVVLDHRGKAGRGRACRLDHKPQRKSNPASGYFPLSLIDIISLRYH